MDKLRQEIDKIVGCNSEVTEDTHNELCTQIYELVERQVKLFAIPDVRRMLPIENIEESLKYHKDKLALYKDFPECSVYKCTQSRIHLLEQQLNTVKGNYA